MRALLFLGLVLSSSLGCSSASSDQPATGGSAGAAGSGGSGGGAGAGAGGAAGSPDSGLPPTGKIVSLYCPNFYGTDGPAEGKPYHMQIPAGGGTAPYTFSLASGELPPGLTLAPDGRISGTPKGANTFTLGTINMPENAQLGAYESTVKIVDAAGSFALCWLQMVVSGDGPLPPTPVPAFSYPQLPIFGAGEPIAFQPAAYNSGAYSFEITGLPAGVEFDPDTALLSGKLDDVVDEAITYRMLPEGGTPIERARSLRTVARPTFDDPFDGTYEGTKEVDAPFAKATGKILFQVKNGKVASEGVQTGQMVPLRGTIDPSTGVFEGEHEGRGASGNASYEMPAMLAGTFSVSGEFVLSGADTTGTVTIKLTLNKRD